MTMMAAQLGHCCADKYLVYDGGYGLAGVVCVRLDDVLGPSLWMR